MKQLILFLLLALFVQSYYALNVTPTLSPDIENISGDNKLTSILCSDDCEIAESYIHFQKYYSDKPNILRQIPNYEDFIAYVFKEGDFYIINNAVSKYAENVGFCYDISDDAISNTAIVVTDMQEAFMSNGPVAVNGAEYAIDYINKAKKYHEYSIHSLDTHLPLWSLSFSTDPNYHKTFFPHAREGTPDFNEVKDLNTCADLYVGKKDFPITSNPLFKEYLLKNCIKKITFTGVAGDYCVNAGILGVLDDPQLSHLKVGLYEPGVKWVFPDSINSQKLNLESYSKFKWINDEEELLHFLNN
jgi:nicotinamidase-related amidase